MNYTIRNLVATFEVIDCYRCGVEFGTPGRFLDERRKDKRDFFCPNGHSQAFITSTIELLQQRLNAAQDATARAEARAQDAENRRRAAVGQTTKLRKRISDGVCPCCHRTFANVARHMTMKHPDFAAEEPV